MMLIFASSLFAEAKFTSNSTGHDWNQASKEYKVEYCKLMEREMQEFAPGISWKVFYDSLNTFYNTSDSKLLQEKITDLIGLTTGIYAKNRQ